MVFKVFVLLAVTAYICMFANAEAKSIDPHMGKVMKDTICEVDKYIQLMRATTKQLELVNEHGVDISSCNVGVVDFDLNKSTTILKVMHLLEDNVNRSNKCVQMILDANMQ